MTSEELRKHIRLLADGWCKNKHRDYYDSLVEVGLERAPGFGPPCDACIAEVTRNYEAKRGKAHPRELSAQEMEELNKFLGPREPR